MKHALACLLAALFLSPIPSHSAQGQEPPPADPHSVIVLEITGTALYQRAGATAWDPLTLSTPPLQPGDSVQAGPNSRVTLLWSKSVVQITPLSTFQILQPESSRQQPGFSLFRGLFYFFHRDTPADLRFRTRTVAGAVRGTEFAVETDDTGRTVVSVLDGTVDLEAAGATATVRSREQAVVEPGRPPVTSAILDTVNIIQWALYYPAILDLAELQLEPEPAAALAESINHYQQGDLPHALAAYPADRRPVTPREQVYLASLQLAVGQVERAQSLLQPPPDDPTAARLGFAIRRLVATVLGKSLPPPQPPALATEWLAESYARQAQGDIPGALEAARAAATQSPAFSFAHARVAELEFSSGLAADASRTLDQALQLGPRNAQAVALQGFVLAARGRFATAEDRFSEAIRLDGALANGWLGRGLCRIHNGDRQPGLQDLLVAAATEPQRSVLRSYLGKAYAATSDRQHAAAELELARQLDPRDPTPLLYRALLRQQYNQVNEAIRDLEQSRALNNNRSIYRSSLLLDQDQSVRTANLASLYRDAGFTDVSMREAGRAVSEDPANYSAHLFLANSFTELRDPQLVNLRYETAATAEYLLANLLAPAAAGTYSPTLSLQEYSRLFEGNRVGLVSSTEYLSRGAIRQDAAQYGVLGDFSYSAEVTYSNDNGERANQDSELLQVSILLKQQLSSSDTVFLQAAYLDSERGDLAQDYDQAQANTVARITETQQPILLAGYHHEWQPGSHTLVLAHWLNDTVTIGNPAHPAYLFMAPGGEYLDIAAAFGIRLDYEAEVNVYGGELQQIWQTEDHTTIVGGRAQVGTIENHSIESKPLDYHGLFPYPPPDPPDPAAESDFSEDLQRFSVYGYHLWQMSESLQLTLGLSYDWLEYPSNFRMPPLLPGTDQSDRLCPKIGLVAHPTDSTVMRGAFTRSLSGATLEQSYQLEPALVAGFVQSYRSVMPESVAGAQAGAAIDTYDLSLEQKLGENTHLALLGQCLKSEVNRTVGIYEHTFLEEFAQPAETDQSMDYQEESVTVSLRQLLGRQLSLGASYRLSQSEMNTELTDVPDSVPTLDFTNKSHQEAILQESVLFAVLNHPSGLFARFQALWFAQENKGDQDNLADDDFWQLDVFAGYRLPGRRAELRLGVLNLTDEDYRLNPVTPYYERPHERTFVARLQFAL